MMYPKGGAAAYRAASSPQVQLPQVSEYDKVRGFHMHELGQEVYQQTLGMLRQQLRTAALRTDVFVGIQESVYDLFAQEISLKLDPILRIREVMQGIMTAFSEKKIDHSEAARVAVVSVVLFHPRGKLEQLDVAKYAACELMMTKINLNTEMVQMSFGIGKAAVTIAGLSTILPAFLNKEQDFLQKLYAQLHDGLWMGTMIATRNSDAHGKANVQAFGSGAESYFQELLAKVAAEKAKSWFKMPFGK